MDMFKSLIVILLSAVLVNNYVLARFLGICPFLGVSKKLDQATGMGIAVTAVILLATAVTWPIQKFVLDALNLGYMQTVVFILVIGTFVVTFVKGISQWNKNNHSPKLTVPATIVAKRTNVSHHHHHNHHHHHHHHHISQWSLHSRWSQVQVE